jgi:hypothetical protein
MQSFNHIEVFETPNNQNLEVNVQNQGFSFQENQNYFHSSKQAEENFHNQIPKTNNQFSSSIESNPGLISINQTSNLIQIMQKIEKDHLAEVELLKKKLLLTQNSEIVLKKQFEDLSKKYKIVENDANKYFKLANATERQNKIISGNYEILLEKNSFQFSDLIGEKKSLESKVITLSNELIHAKGITNVLQRESEKNKFVFASEIEELRKNQTSSIKHQVNKLTASLKNELESEKLKSNALLNKIKKISTDKNNEKEKLISKLKSKNLENKKILEIQTTSLKRDLNTANIETRKSHDELKKIKLSHAVEIKHNDELILNIHKTLEQATQDLSGMYNVTMTNLKFAIGKPFDINK